MRLSSSNVYPLSRDSLRGNKHPSGDNNRSNLLTEEISQLRRNKYEEPEAGRKGSLEAMCYSRNYTD